MLAGMVSADPTDGLDLLLLRLENSAEGGDRRVAEEVYTQACATALLLEAERRRLRRTVGSVLTTDLQEPGTDQFSRGAAGRLQLLSEALTELRSSLTRVRALHRL